MTEQEYIDATNLAKLRIVRATLHECLWMRDSEAKDMRPVTKALAEMEIKLTKRVKCKPEE